MVYTKQYGKRSPDWNYGGAKWKLSRSKIELFVECPRCFYLDNKLGIRRPSFPPFNLNIAVDELFKAEFDTYRTAKKPHPLMKKNKIDAVPYQHEKLDEWRENFTGVTFFHEPTGFTISGAVDDIWVNKAGELMVVDYKATSKDGEINDLEDSSWNEQYRRQIGVYQWLLRQNGFTVSHTGYFVYANAKKDLSEFRDTLHFKTTVIPCEGDTNWIELVLTKVKTCLESGMYPDSTPNCEYCAYRELSGKTLLHIQRENSKS